MNGNATASFSPASEVSANRTSSVSSLPGGPTCTSPASTGSVGASAPPSSSAQPKPSPSIHQPSSVSRPIDTGMVTKISR